VSFDIRPDGIVVIRDYRIPKFFRVAIAFSVLLHFAMLLTSPYWQSRPTTRDDIVQIDIAEMPKEEIPQIPEAAVRAPEAVPPPPPRPKAAPTEAAPAAEAPPSREAIREKVATQGILRMLGGKTDPLPAVRLPSDLRPAPPRAAASPGDYAPRIAEEGGKSRTPGIDRQLAATTRAPKAMASQTFRTDTGLEAEVSGAAEEPSRSFQAIAATVKQYQSGIKYVYNRELLSNPNLGGKMMVAFVIQPDGTVDSVEVRQSSLNWPALDEAVKKRMQHWRFPRSPGGPVRVVFPFVFHPEM
jgi:TonB family protein